MARRKDRCTWLKENTLHKRCLQLQVDPLVAGSGIFSGCV